MTEKSGVKLLNEEQQKEVAKYLSSLSDDELMEKMDQYQDMPTCMALAVREASKRGL